MPGLTNYRTSVMGRVASNTQVPKAEMDDIVVFARDHLSYDSLHTWNVTIDGVVIQLVTNSDHLMDFWMENWFPTYLERVTPHGTIYAVTGVPGREPSAFYCSEMKTVVFLNTDYYGQCKSWALGMVADIMETQHRIHSIHGAVVDIGGTGICIIAPTGTGKSTHSYGLVFSLPEARMHSDDWCYVDYIGGEEQGRASATISERKFYLRTDIANTFPRLGEIFQRCKLENVGDTFSAVPNSRAILDPKWIGGPDKFCYTTRIRCVVLLRRDQESPPELSLGPEEALSVLEKGEYMMLPGAGSKEEWGKMKSEPFYNHYLLVRTPDRTQFQRQSFRKLLNYASCHVLNTGVETVEESRERILRIAREVTARVRME